MSGILANIGLGHYLLVVQCQAVIWTKTDLLTVGPLWTKQWNFLWNTIISCEKMHLKMLYAQCRPFCSGLNVSSYIIMLTSLCSFQIIQCNTIYMYCIYIYWYLLLVLIWRYNSYKLIFIIYLEIALLYGNLSMKYCDENNVHGIILITCMDFCIMISNDLN